MVSKQLKVKSLNKELYKFKKQAFDIEAKKDGKSYLKSKLLILKRRKTENLSIIKSCYDFMKRGYAAKIGERLKFLSLLDRPASRRSRSMRRVEGSYIKKKGSLPGGRLWGEKPQFTPRYK
jgi:hypothetical protein